MERSYLICYLVGRHFSNDPSLSGKDLKVMVDNSLIESKIPPIGSEETDLQLMEELLSEIMIGVLGKGINRKTRRLHGVTNRK